MVDSCNTVGTPAGRGAAVTRGVAMVEGAVAKQHHYTGLGGVLTSLTTGPASLSAQERGRLGGRPLGLGSRKERTTVAATRWISVRVAATRLEMAPSYTLRLIRERSLMVRSSAVGHMIREIDLDVLRPVVQIPRAVAESLRRVMVEALAGGGDPVDFRRHLDRLEIAIDPRLGEDDPVEPPRRAKARPGKGDTCH